MLTFASLAVGAIMGFLYGTIRPTARAILNSRLTMRRYRQRFPIRCGHDRCHEDTRTVHAHVWLDIRVSDPTFFPGKLVNITLLTRHTYSCFMAVGSVIRSDADPKWQDIYIRAQRRPMIIREQARWQREKPDT
jgi:hypothetical protein